MLLTVNTYFQTVQLKQSLRPIKICFLVCLFYASNAGDVENAVADCGGQHVQELLHHRGHVSSPPLLRLCRSCSVWNCQIWGEHQPVT